MVINALQFHVDIIFIVIAFYNKLLSYSNKGGLLELLHSL